MPVFIEGNYGATYMMYVNFIIQMEDKSEELTQKTCGNDLQLE